MIVVVSVHAYNIGVVKYDWKVLYTVTRSAVTLDESKHDWELRPTSVYFFLNLGQICKEHLGNNNVSISTQKVTLFFRILAVEMRSLLVKKSDPEDQGHKCKARPRLLCLVLIGLINLALCLYFGIR